jgi:hypothetical protein
LGATTPVQRLVVEDRWDLQARLGDEIPLDRVDALGDLVGQLVPEQADAGDVPDALSEQAVHLAGHRPIRSQQGQRNDTGQPHRLLLDRHLTQQLIGALHRGGGGIGRDGCHS